MQLGIKYSITAQRDNDQERDTVYDKRRLTTITKDGGLRNSDTSRNRGREGEVVLRDGGSAVAPECALCHMHSLGDSPRHSAADCSARVPKVLPTEELEGVLAGLITAVSPEPVDCAAVVYDVEEPQELGSMAHATAVKVATSCLVLSRALRLCRGSWSPGVGSSGKTRHHGPPPCISLEGFLARWGSRARSRVFIK